jgi:hypothetical protein
MLLDLEEGNVCYTRLPRERVQDEVLRLCGIVDVHIHGIDQLSRYSWDSGKAAHSSVRTYIDESVYACARETDTQNVF